MEDSATPRRAVDPSAGAAQDEGTIDLVESSAASRSPASCFRSAEFGFVGADRSFVEFLCHVFELDELPPIELDERAPFGVPRGTLYRLQAAGCVLKVFVPIATPTASPPTEAFDLKGGPRFVTIRVDDFSGVYRRALERGALVLSPPAEARRGVRFARLHHPYGGTIEIVESE